MQRGIKIPVDWALLGAELAHSDNHAQAEFIKAFLKECRGWGTNLQVERQFAEINMLLTDEEKEALSMLSYHEEE